MPFLTRELTIDLVFQDNTPAPNIPVSITLVDGNLVLTEGLPKDKTNPVIVSNRLETTTNSEGQATVDVVPNELLEGTTLYRVVAHMEERDHDWYVTMPNHDAVL